MVANHTIMIGPETPHPRRAVALAHEEGEENHESGGHHQVAQLRDGDFDSFHGTEHGDGRGDDAVSVEEGRAEEPESDEVAAALFWRSRAIRARMPPSP
jgi:hypothetical protein